MLESYTGCILAAVVFNMFLVVVTLAFQHDKMKDDWVGINYRLGSNLFILCILQVKFKWLLIIFLKFSMQMMLH